MSSLVHLAALLALCSNAFAATIPRRPDFFPRLNPRADDCNTATTRSSWCGNVTVDANTDTTWPTDGQTVSYELRLTNTTCSPDGNGDQTCFLINDQFPGPTLRASWGDTLNITVINELQDNGTSIHWHGVRQLNSSIMDGTNGITECPIPPGSSRSYQFKATQHGTSWYHSHHSAQYGMGVVGAIQIDGPATANYDVDLGTLPISDWYYDSAWVLAYRAVHDINVAPTQDNVIVNGSMVNADGGGEYTKISVESGKTYRLRIINAAVDHFFHVSMDGHPFTVIAADFVPTEPQQVTDLPIFIGQRYDILFTANQDVGNYWLRVQPGCSFGGRAAIYDADVVVGAIISYDGADDDLPTSTGYDLATNCTDLTVAPHWNETVPSAEFAAKMKEIDVTLGTSGTEDIVVNWFINGSSMVVDWGNPTLEYIHEGDTSFPTNLNVLQMSEDNEWYFWVIQTVGFGLPHPIHVHGHDFYVLGSGMGTYNGSTDDLNFANPVRRDVATLPQGGSGGFLIVALKADNPGAWAMHCHIAWHASEGFSMEFVERESEISFNNWDMLTDGCSAWNNWWDSSARIYSMDDSGL